MLHSKCVHSLVTNLSRYSSQCGYTVLISMLTGGVAVLGIKIQDKKSYLSPQDNKRDSQITNKLLIKSVELSLQNGHEKICLTMTMLLNGEISDSLVHNEK